MQRKKPVPDRPKACNFIKKETLAQVFSCEFCELSKNSSFTEHLQATAFAFKVHWVLSFIRIIFIEPWVSKKLNNCKIITCESGSGSHMDLRITPTIVFFPSLQCFFLLWATEEAIYKSFDPNLSVQI